MGLTTTSASAHGEPKEYGSLTRALVPAWLRIVGSAPWWDVATGVGQVVRRPVVQLYRQQASALGLCTVLRLERDCEQAAYIRACTRAAQVHWQAGLDPTGCPASPRWRGSKLWVVVAQQVVRRLDLGDEPPTGDVLEDLARHLAWQRRRTRDDSPWAQSAMIEALALAAPLLRDSALLTEARRRLPMLLHQQSSEGWFRESGGPDVGRLSLTMDALTRLFLELGWEELFDPLVRALRFLVLLVHPDGSAGGCYCSCQTGFVSPYAMERLAERIPEAARLARALRARYATIGSGAPSAWNDNLTSVLGSAIAATAACSINTSKIDRVGSEESATVSDSGAPSNTIRPISETSTTTRDEVFPDAALTVVRRPAYVAIVAGQRGGAMQVRWNDTGRVVELPGVTVVFAHTVRSGRVAGAGYQIPTEHGSMSWRGILLRGGPRRTRWWRRAWRVSLGRWFQRRRGSIAARFQHDTIRGRHRLLHDWFGRDITFHVDGMTIRDQVLCRLPAEAIVLESSIGEDRWVDRMGRNAPTGAPLMIEGGRATSITRVFRRGQLESCRVERHVDMF